jgi:hypothetical protein
MMLVYFLKLAGMDGPIKIGCAYSPEARVRQLQYDLKVKIEILTTAAGDFFTERNLHRKFASIRAVAPFDQTRAYLMGGPTEWFEPAPELLAFIAGVKATGTIWLADHERVEVIVRNGRREGRTYASIGAELGVTRQRAHQIYSQVGRAA